MTDADREAQIREWLEAIPEAAPGTEQTGWLSELLFFRRLLDEARAEVIVVVL